MMEKEGISTSAEKKIETCEENVESSRMSKQLCNIFSLFVSIPFKRLFIAFCFLSTLFFNIMSFHSTPILRPHFALIFSTHYPPPVLVKHPIWYLNHANLFISVWGTLYGVHWALTIQVIFVPSWMSSTQYSLYPEDINHNDKFHSTILMKCHYIN